MMKTLDKGVLALVFEFLISVVTLLGGGFLLYTDHQTAIATTAITAVITWWFARRMTDKQNNTTQSNQTTQSTQAPDQALIEATANAVIKKISEPQPQAAATSSTSSTSSK